MSNELEAVKALINSTKYLSLAKYIIQKANKTLVEQADDDEYKGVLMQLKAADLSIYEIEHLVSKSNPLLERFCLSMIKSEKALEQGVEINSEKFALIMDKDEQDAGYCGHSLTYLVSFCILYLLLMDNNAKRILAWLKKMHQPKPERYQRLLDHLFDGLQ